MVYCANRVVADFAGDDDDDDIYGYGDEGSPVDNVDFGYEYDSEATRRTQSPASEHGESLQRSKRRCSITKYSLEGGGTSLNAASIIRDFRNGIIVEPNDSNIIVTTHQNQQAEICSSKRVTEKMAKSSPEESNTDLTNSTEVETVKEVSGAVSSCSALGSSKSMTVVLDNNPAGTTIKRKNLLARFFRCSRRAQAA